MLDQGGINQLQNKLYLGDGVYVGAEPSGYQLWLWTERSGGIHAIALDNGVLNTFTEYLAALAANNA